MNKTAKPVLAVMDGAINAESDTLARSYKNDPYPTAADLREARATVELAAEALARADRLMSEALPKFNWGASALDANAIQLLNEVPGEVRAALAAMRGES